ncbi:peptidylprolyl isomerase [Pseudothauera rhizosphaerae]|uniref:Peptidyl-prolyl cis-trans isomerase n=1 Tax=Pseudothauera rhizosphaerae TaxID=2565932 RepID=A0A4S4ART7_9RHOO|nr:peptidylprolyl isomerase [Pseudothauera rhizosphaerae]THF62510.1 peptidyl-prolyl cis-trans isomerase [Pseudothauera rhizosphaerae]
MKKLLALFALLGCIATAGAANPQVELDTTQGRIVLELYPDKAPKTVANFLEYVSSGYYDGTVFHRVIDGFMVQGGGFDAQMNQKTTRAPIENEARNGLKNVAGSIAMARTQAPHSASSQFFINLVNNESLDYPSFDGWGYAVFGKVTQGLDVVQKIGKLPVRNVGFHQNVPAEHVIVKRARVLETH